MRLVRMPVAVEHWLGYRERIELPAAASGMDSSQNGCWANSMWSAVHCDTVIAVIVDLFGGRCDVNCAVLEDRRGDDWGSAGGNDAPDASDSP